ncbi:YlbF family regulator [Anaerosalibacter bizertensis]|uniref:YlbF family regulator n=1 Tax=Anaerosalibacter bizertensis TaxID=932217 RepID=A0A9Q4AAD3_9FIRM|nr:YlbF family regulator [Anaerosalibacter bizertensis]MBV1818171.1 YlbF family regulator [Bacteroidales bacterium MSK.15.36]HHV26094.1 YlbF family regulator [Tissierellia bacterium]MBU5292773.1 YlbF family regulator [Anaerosalibacter bizertensis]MCB5558435.1 YlbF family regulator [Anaerosalibacter bizertensis]MCG4564199.1 YlbF family regulator [Anaerosalibacter bizertensis]
MNVYDEAHKLARAIKESDEYNEYFEKQKNVFSDVKNKEMIDDFREKALEVQMEQLSGKEVDKEKIEKLQKLEQILMLNPDIKEFFIAEMKFTQLISDVYKILDDVIKLDTLED